MGCAILPAHLRAWLFLREHPGVLSVVPVHHKNPYQHPGREHLLADISRTVPRHSGTAERGMFCVCSESFVQAKQHGPREQEEKRTGRDIVLLQSGVDLFHCPVHRELIRVAYVCRDGTMYRRHQFDTDYGAIELEHPVPIEW